MHINTSEHIYFPESLQHLFRNEDFGGFGCLRLDTFLQFLVFA
jgi:hypothetical protein